MSSTLIPLWWAVLAIGSLFTAFTIALLCLLTMYRSERRFRKEAYDGWQRQLVEHLSLAQSRNFLRAQIDRLQDQNTKLKRHLAAK